MHGRAVVEWCHSDSVIIRFYYNPAAMGGFETTLQAARAGNRSACGALLDPYLERLHGFVRLRAGPGLRARESFSDFVQTVCRVVLRDLADFRGRDEAAFRAWLFRLAARKLADRRKYWQARRRTEEREVANLSEPEEEALRSSYASVESPSQLAIAREENRRIEAAFDCLTEEQREVLTLFCFAGMDHAAIGAITGRSVEASRALLTRARVRLAMILGSGETPRST